MSGQPLNVVVIGAGMYVCGRGTDGFGTILPTLIHAQDQGDVEDIWVVATNPESAQEASQKVRALATKTGIQANVQYVPQAGSPDPFAYRKVFEQMRQPACAIVAVPDHLHAPIASDAIRAGLHALVVKPLAPTLAEARQLVELADRHHVYGAVDFHKRWDEANLLLRQMISDGRLGELRYITVEYSQRRIVREAFVRWLQHTNIFQYLGVHYADLIYFVTGAHPVRVLATGQPSHVAKTDRSSLDAVQAVIEWEGGPRSERFASTIVTNWIDPNTTSAMSDQAIRVVGTNGRYDSDQKHRGVQLVTEHGGVEDLNPYFSQLYTDPTDQMRMQGYGPRSIRQFLTDVQGVVEGRAQIRDLIDARPSFQQAVVSTAIVEAVNRSLEAGSQWVSIELDPSTRATASGRGPLLRVVLSERSESKDDVPVAQESHAR